MSSDTDQPRQRTVAELLAEHGDSAATGRRRRRREADASGGGAPSDSASGTTAAVDAVAARFRHISPARAVTSEPVPGLARDNSARVAGAAADAPAPQAPDRSPDPRQAPEAFTPSDQQDRPTDRMPRVRDVRPGALDPGSTGPMDLHWSAEDVAPPVPVGDGRANAVGEDQPPASAWERMRASRRSVTVDGGPPTQADAPFDLDDLPVGRVDLVKRAEPVRPGAGADRGTLAVLDAPVESGRRLGRSAVAASSGQAWMAVVAQWIVGAVGGAALWVGFRFLWRELPVVALAAAMIVTVGLVLAVRALLRNDDLRTTMFAVLVGLLLTVSPALLVLLGK